MREDPQMWATLTNFGNIPQMKKYLSKRAKNDHRNSTSKLKEIALTGKLRERKYNSFSSSNNLQDGAPRKEYPMEHTRAESVTSSTNHQAVRKQFEIRVKRAKEESESLRAYSLSMFENSLGAEQYQSVPPTPRPVQGTRQSQINLRRMSAKSSNGRLETCTESKQMDGCHTPINNGPTESGSLLYNQKGKLMNSIRLRPQSETISMFNHRKGSIVAPTIQQTLNKSNGCYRVQSANESELSRSVSGSCSSISELRLVPVSVAAENGHTGQNRNNSYKKSEDLHMDGPSETPSLSTVSNLCDDVFDSIYVDRIEPPAPITYSDDFLKRNMPPPTVHYYSLEYESESEASVEDKPPEPVVEKPPTPPPEEPKKGKGSAKGGRGSAKSGRGGSAKGKGSAKGSAKVR